MTFSSLFTPQKMTSLASQNPILYHPVFGLGTKTIRNQIIAEQIEAKHPELDEFGRTILRLGNSSLTHPIYGELTSALISQRVHELRNQPGVKPWKITIIVHKILEIIFYIGLVVALTLLCKRLTLPK